MPAEFIIDPQHRVVFSTGTGTFTHADFLEHMSRVGGHRDFNPDFDHVVDCRPIALLDLNSEQLKELAGQSIFSARSRRAFVVSSDLHFGLGRMFAAYREIAGGQNVRIFRNMPDALAWLGLSPDLDPCAAGGSGTSAQGT